MIFLYSSFDECRKSLELRYATQIWNEQWSKKKIPHDQSVSSNFEYGYIFWDLSQSEKLS